MSKKKKETREEFYARNAKNGRTARFSMTMDTRYLSEKEAKDAGFKQRLEVIIRGGTLTPKQAKQIQDIVFGA